MASMFSDVCTCYDYYSQTGEDTWCGLCNPQTEKSPNTLTDQYPSLARAIRSRLSPAHQANFDTWPEEWLTDALMDLEETGEHEISGKYTYTGNPMTLDHTDLEEKDI